MSIVYTSDWAKFSIARHCGPSTSVDIKNVFSINYCSLYWEFIVFILSPIECLHLSEFFFFFFCLDIVNSSAGKGCCVELLGGVDWMDVLGGTCVSEFCINLKGSSKH